MTILGDQGDWDGHCDGHEPNKSTWRFLYFLSLFRLRSVITAKGELGTLNVYNAPSTIVTAITLFVSSRVPLLCEHMRPIFSQEMHCVRFIKLFDILSYVAQLQVHVFKIALKCDLILGFWRWVNRWNSWCNKSKDVWECLRMSKDV